MKIIKKIESKKQTFGINEDDLTNRRDRTTQKGGNKRPKPKTDDEGAANQQNAEILESYKKKCGQ